MTGRDSKVMSETATSALATCTARSVRMSVLKKRQTSVIYIVVPVQSLFRTRPKILNSSSKSNMMKTATNCATPVNQCTLCN